MRADCNTFVFVALWLLAAHAHAGKPDRDAGRFDAPGAFRYRHVFLDTVGLSGSATVEVLSRDPVQADRVAQLYAWMYGPAVAFLFSHGEVVSSEAPPLRVQIRVVRVEELNDPRNIVGTDVRCMRDPHNCASGAYLGLTFYRGLTNVVVYVSDGEKRGEYSFEGTVLHELMHVILRRQLIAFLWSDRREHALIGKFVRTFVPVERALHRSTMARRSP